MTIGVRMLGDRIATLDAWIARQEEPALSRPEAIRRLVELGLAGSPPSKATSPKAAAKASDMAGKQIDRLTDHAAAPAEQAKRKRTLLKGPPEFRETRVDHPKKRWIIPNG